MKIINILTKLTLLSVSLVFGPQAAAVECPAPQCQPLGYIGAMELSTTNLANGAKGYRGWFENGGWQGDLIEYDVTSGGGISTCIDLSDTSPKQPDGCTNWSAHARFAAKAGSSSHWDDGRKIIFSNNYGLNQNAFRWAELTLDQKLSMDNLTSVNATGNASEVLNYLRGDRVNEGAAGSMRTRFTVLGDIVHSNPEYVGAPDESYSENDYSDFKNDNADRSPSVYVGANDGMLHAFNATNGQEKWAYVPSMLIPKMKQLAGRPYPHTYFVDGGITIRDAYIDGSWNTVLVGSLGAGGRGIYALNVTNPWLGSETASTGTAKKIMWEERAENTPGDADPGPNPPNPDIGYIFDSSTIAKLNDGKWYAVFGNGIGSDNGVAVLMMKELRTAWVTTTPVKVSTGSGAGNGLAAPALVDTNNDGMADIAWAGDIHGDMWRFDLSGGPGNWKKVYKVYDGDPSQPITVAPDVAVHPQLGHVVMFGTGKLYDDADVESTTPQALYGVWDTGSTPTTNPLLAQELSFNTVYNRYGFTENVRTYTTTIAVDYTTHRGWKVELFPGERMLTTPQLRAGRMKTTIYNPNDGTNWLLEATFLNGYMADNSIYNLNQDSKLDEDDRINANGNDDENGNPDYGDPEDIPMAWKRPDGNMSQPTIASLSQGVDTMFLNFLNPPAVESAASGGCEGICEGGLEGGHIDLDYDVALGGGTNDHDHEYDDHVGRTYIDYLDLVKQNDITAVVDNSETWVALIANADLSKGGTLILSRNDGSEDLNYNVVQYQKMIHEALKAWDGVSELKTPALEGAIPLTFKLEDVDQMAISFNSLALISGGLIPSVTGCVKANSNPETGRWRNGALTLHLVRASHLATYAVAGSALDGLVVQTPVDFQEAVYLTGGTGVALTNPGADGIVNAGGPGDYEIYGGLHADLALADPGFLYESTMFWHYKGACYGEKTWAADYIKESQYTALAIFYEKFDRYEVTSLDELAAKIDGLVESGCGVVGGGDSGGKDDKDDKDAKDAADAGVVPDTTTDGVVSCQAELDELAELWALGNLIEDATGTTIKCNEDGCIGDGSDATGEGSGTSISGDPFAIIGGVDEGGITSGPNFESGRRTWIDIMPE